MARTGSEDRGQGASQQLGGRLKEAVGALSGNRGKAQEGRNEQTRGRLRERWGHFKNALGK